MEDRVNFLNKITEEKKMISSEIREIDETLNDKEKLKKEYINRNSKLSNKDKIFSVSFLYDILENERKAQVEKLKTMNIEEFINFCILNRKYLVKEEQLEVI